LPSARLPQFLLY